MRAQRGDKHLDNRYAIDQRHRPNGRMTVRDKGLSIIYALVYRS